MDEISWMGAYNPDFAGILKIAWDRFFSKHERLVVIFCGSVSAWIAQNILNSTGFVGRNSLDLELGELPCKVLECLAEGPASVSEFAVRTHAPTGGRLSLLIQDLRHAGFVGSDAGLNPMTGRIDLRLERMKAR